MRFFASSLMPSSNSSYLLFPSVPELIAFHYSKGLLKDSLIISHLMFILTVSSSLCPPHSFFFFFMILIYVATFLRSCQIFTHCQIHSMVFALFQPECSSRHHLPLYIFRAIPLMMRVRFFKVAPVEVHVPPPNLSLLLIFVFYLLYLMRLLFVIFYSSSGLCFISPFL